MTEVIVAFESRVMNQDTACGGDNKNGDEESDSGGALDVFLQEERTRHLRMA